MDPPGILMLNSIKEIIPIDKVNFVLEKFDQPRMIIDAIDYGKKCPVVAAAEFDLSTRPIQLISTHCMVATGIKGEQLMQGRVGNALVL